MKKHLIAKKRILAVTVAAMLSAPAFAFDFIDNTFLTSISQGSNLSSKADSLRGGGFEMADGTYKSYDKWYAPKGWTDMHVGFITTLSRTFGITWGFSTGESGQKYRIEPSFRLGLVSTHLINKDALFTVRAYNTFGGRLIEKACEADYGEVGGIQQVNCRMAASPLPPAETLQYMIKERPMHAWMVSVDLNVKF